MHVTQLMACHEHSDPIFLPMEGMSVYTTRTCLCARRSAFMAAASLVSACTRASLRRHRDSTTASSAAARADASCVSSQKDVSQAQMANEHESSALPHLVCPCDHMDSGSGCPWMT